MSEKTTKHEEGELSESELDKVAGGGGVAKPAGIPRITVIGKRGSDSTGPTVPSGASEGEFSVGHDPDWHS